MAQSSKSKFGLTVLICALWLPKFSDCYKDRPLRCDAFQSPENKVVYHRQTVDIRFPDDGNYYRSNQRCDWMVIAHNPDDVLQIRIKKAKIQGQDIYENCNYDYVDLFNVKPHYQDLIARFCGVIFGNVYTSSGSHMLIRFISDVAYEFDGFHAEIKAIPASEAHVGQHSNDSVRNVALGVPVALVLAAGAGLALLLALRRRRMQRGRARGPTSDLSANVAPSRVARLDASHPFVAPNPPPPPYISSEPTLQVRLPPNAPQMGGEFFEPPPAYEASDHGPHLPPPQPVSPPAYEDIVKESAPSTSQS